ncbi:hypothetical protein AABB24_036907, partial [Solanum stoloniferum]
EIFHSSSPQKSTASSSPNPLRPLHLPARIAIAGEDSSRWPPSLLHLLSPPLLLTGQAKQLRRGKASDSSGSSVGEQPRRPSTTAAPAASTRRGHRRAVALAGDSPAASSSLFFFSCRRTAPAAATGQQQPARHTPATSVLAQQ